MPLFHPKDWRADRMDPAWATGSLEITALLGQGSGIPLTRRAPDVPVRSGEDGTRWSYALCGDGPYGFA